MEFSAIHRQARINNQRSGITGLLGFSAGRYLQILEGDEVSVDSTFKKIERDPRHRILAVLVNQVVDQRFFEGCSMRVVASLSDCDEFDEYLNSHEVVIDGLPGYAKKLLKTFATTTKTPPFSTTFENKQLSLSNWPDFTKVGQTPMVLGLSAKLVAGAESYHSLAASGEFGTRTQLDEFLRSFELMGILVVSDDHYTKMPSVGHYRNHNESAFYQRVKTFLGL